MLRNPNRLPGCFFPQEIRLRPHSCNAWEVIAIWEFWGPTCGTFGAAAAVVDATVAAAHSSLTLIKCNPFLLMFNVKLRPSLGRKDWLVAMSIRAPGVFMVWIDSKNGVASGATSINSHIF